MLDLNSNVLPLNSQLQTSSSLLNQPISEFSSVRFTDLLASLQAESEQFQNETSGGLAAQPFHYANSLPVYTPREFAVTHSNSTSSSQSTSERSASSTQLMASSNTDHARSVSSTEHATPAVSGRASSNSDSETEPVSVGISINSKQGLVSQPSTPLQTDSQTAGEPAVQAASVAKQQALQLQTSQSQPLQQQPSQQQALLQQPLTQQALQQQDLPQQTAASGESGAVTSGVISKNNSAISGSDAKNQQSALPAAVASNDVNFLSQTLVPGTKSMEKLKTHKDEISQGQSSAVNGSTAAATDPLIAAMNTDPVINTAVSLVPADVGENSVSLATKGSSRGKTDSSSSDLAFAIKIQGNNPIVNGLSQTNLLASISPDLSNTEAQITTASFSAQMIGMASLLGHKAELKEFSGAETGSGGLAALTSTAPISATALAGSDDDAPATDESAPVAAVAEDQPVSTQPVKTVQVQITGADDQKVDLKLVEKSGSLTMSVRSTDGSLTKTLQQNLPDLSARLNEQQIKAEWWRPDAQQPEIPKNSGNSSGSTGNSANQDQGGQSKGNSGQQGGRGNPRPDWVEDHNLSRKSNQNGTSFSWQL